VAATRSSITIRRSIEDVFAVLTDVTKTGRWFPMRVEERWTSPPPHGVGSTRRATIWMLGRRVENDAVATIYAPPHRAAIRGLSPNAPFEAILDFAPVEGGTQVEVRTAILIGGIGRPIGALFARWYGRQWSRGLVNLKRLMEAGEL
jgi:polyketide cyclase/dehydrase/lipid transport protein